MKSRSKLAALMAVIALVFAMIAAISPAALAGQSKVFFSDVSGNPKAQWETGETLYVTVVSHNENRDSDEVEFIDARSQCETHTGVSVPCVEIWDPNTKDSETNLGSLVLVETGANSGIFRTQTGIPIHSFEESPATENGALESYTGDTIVARYQGPSDDTDVSLDLAKIGATAGVVRITNQAGQTRELWQLGQQVFVTVEDPDVNLDSQTPDTLEGVTLWNSRCVWNVLERGGQPRSDQPQPKPCEGVVAYDDSLRQFAQDQGISPNVFAGSLTLEETGPDTGVFRNVNGITLSDQLGPVRDFPTAPTAQSLFVNHKDTIVAFYREPTIVSPGAPEEEPELQTDDCGLERGLTCTRARPAQVSTGETFQVTVEITPEQDMSALILREMLPAGFSFEGIVSSSPSAVTGESAGTLRVFWNGDVNSGEKHTVTYELSAGGQTGTFTLKGVILGRDPRGAGVVLSDIEVTSGASGQSLRSASVSAQASNQNSALRLELSPSTTNPGVGTTFTVSTTATARQDLGAGAVRLNFDGFTLESHDFFRQSGNQLVAIFGSLSSGSSQSNQATLSCPSEGSFTLTASAGAQDVDSVEVSETINCGPGAGPGPAPTPVAGFSRGRAGFNDPQDFDLAQAKIGHVNPASLKFTDNGGNELDTFALGTEFFLTLEDEDQNIDSDHVETLCIQVFNVNGGREGDTPGIARQLQDVLKNDPRACREDHVRDLFMWKTGVKLVETGPDTGVFRNPNALKLIPICAEPEAEEYGFDTDPNGTAQIQIHKQGWADGLTPQTVLKACHPSTPFIAEGKSEFTTSEDEPGMIAAHAGDTVFAVFQDQLVDPHDIVYGTSKVDDFHTFDGERNTVEFVDADGNAVSDGEFKVGNDVFVRVEDANRNVNGNVVDKFEVLVLDRATGDWENVLLEETGADTGVFVNHAGLSLQPATSPGAVRVNNDRLEVFDRDSIEAHYQDNFNAKDYSLAWVRLIPQPSGEIRPVTPTDAFFSDAQGVEVSDYAVGDSVYVTVEDASQNTSPTVVNTIAGAITVTNTRTGESVTVDATETGADTGEFISDEITTGAPGVDVDLVVADGDQLEVQYVDPQDPSDTATDTVAIVTGVFNFTGARNTPNPFQTTTTFEALGTGIAHITVNIYDLSGQLIRTLEQDGDAVTWSGDLATGGRLSNGVYLYTITATGRQGEEATSDVQKLVYRK